MRGGSLTDLFDLSDNEVVIGTYNSKPIYRRVIVLNQYYQWFDTGIKNVDLVFKMDMMVEQTNTAKDWRNIPWLYANGLTSWFGGFYFSGVSGRVYLQIGSDLQQFNKMVLIVEYTKTTD